MTHTILRRVTALAGLTALPTGTASAASPTAFVLVRATPHTMPQAQVTADAKSNTGGPSAVRKTLTFSQKLVRLTAVTGPDRDMLSYRIDGLRNPTLVVPRGATLQVLFINTDDDMFHNIRFGAWRASWSADAAPLMKTSVGMPPLPHGTDTSRRIADRPRPREARPVRLLLHRTRSRRRRHVRRDHRPLNERMSNHVLALAQCI